VNNSAAITKSVWIKATVLVLLLASSFGLLHWTPLGDFISEENLVKLLTGIRQIWWAPMALIALYAVLAPLGITVVPLIVAGAVFGPVLGSLYNSAGLIVGATVSFWLARGLGRRFVQRMLGERARKIERFTGRHGFWPLVQTRFLPLPFPVVNFGAALAGFPPIQFVLASIVGLVPSTIIHSFFIANIMFVQGVERIWYGVGYGASFVVFNLLIGVPWFQGQRRRATRYRELLGIRANRCGDPNER